MKCKSLHNVQRATQTTTLATFASNKLALVRVAAAVSNGKQLNSTWYSRL